MNLNSREWCDLLFEGKNKAYGAYVTRTRSGRRHLVAFVISVAIIALCIGIPKLVDELLYQHYQQEEESVMAEQYKLLDAIMDENLNKEHEKISVPVPNTKESKSTADPTKISSLTPDLMKLTQPTVVEEDPYLQELIQEKQEKDEKKQAEEEQTAPKDDQLYTIVEEMPSFPGGEQGLLEYLGKNLRYPYSAISKKIANTVTCCFFVEKDGSIKQPTVVQPVNPLLDREAIRVLLTMPKWQPARKHGKPIRVKYILPVSFRLQ